MVETKTFKQLRKDYYKLGAQAYVDGLSFESAVGTMIDATIYKSTISAWRLGYIKARRAAENPLDDVIDSTAQRLIV